MQAHGYRCFLSHLDLTMPDKPTSPDNPTSGSSSSHGNDNRESAEEEPTRNGAKENRREKQPSGDDVGCMGESAASTLSTRASPFSSRQRAEEAEEEVRLTGRRIPVDSIPRSLEYKRVAQLELWEVWRKQG